MSSPRVTKSKRIALGAKTKNSAGKKMAKQAGTRNARSPGSTLKALRQRSGVSQTVCAKALGFGAASGYARYENDEIYKTSPIPYKVIEAIRPHVVGRGVPPVTDDELWAISEVKGLKGLLPDVAALAESSPPVARPTPQSVPTPMSAQQPLETRYRAESGTFSAWGQPTARKYPAAPVLPSLNYPIPAQFAVSVGDDHAAELGIKAGGWVHCVDLEAKEVEAGSKVVAARRVDGFQEILVATAIKPDVNGWICEAGGSEFPGTVLGVAIKAYTPI